MYRPNRIGPHPVANLNKAVALNSLVDFATSEETALAVLSTISLNVTSGENFMHESVYYNVAAGVLLADDKQVGIGVQITDTEEERHRHIYSVWGTLSGDYQSHLTYQFCIGRLTAAPSLTVGVAVPNAISLPLNTWSAGNGSIHMSCNTSFVSTELDGGSVPSTFFDLAAFWRIQNVGGNANLIGLNLNVGIHKYKEDLLTFDPAR